MSKSKPFWQSKTLWVNLIAIAAMEVQSRTGYVIPAEGQAALLAVVNLVLRIVTDKPLDWSTPPRQEP